MQKNLKKLYYSTKPGGYIRRFLIQTHLIFLCLFNTLLHIMPFEFWKRFLCSLAGIKLCKGSTLCSGVRFLAFGKCIIGERTLINRDCLLDNRAGLKIGSDVSIATGVKIFTQGHDVDTGSFKVIGGKVIIEDYVCIFSSALIMPNIKLSKSCVVYPGSVVTKSVGIAEIVGGNPAKFLRMREGKQTYKLNSNFWFN